MTLPLIVAGVAAVSALTGYAAARMFDARNTNDDHEEQVRQRHRAWLEAFIEASPDFSAFRNARKKRLNHHIHEIRQTGSQGDVVVRMQRATEIVRGYAERMKPLYEQMREKAREVDSLSERYDSLKRERNRLDAAPSLDECTGGLGCEPVTAEDVVAAQKKLLIASSQLSKIKERIARESVGFLPSVKHLIVDGSNLSNGYSEDGYGFIGLEPVLSVIRLAHARGLKVHVFFDHGIYGISKRSYKRNLTASILDQIIREAGGKRRVARAGQPADEPLLKLAQELDDKDKGSVLILSRDRFNDYARDYPIIERAVAPVHITREDGKLHIQSKGLQNVGVFREGDTLTIPDIRDAF